MPISSSRRGSLLHADFQSSGKFATNALMLALGQVAYNVLRLCDQVTLAEDRDLPPSEKMPLSKPVTRRLRSVIQDLMYLAAWLTRHASRFGLKLRCDNLWRRVWQHEYHRFAQPAALGLGRSPWKTRPPTHEFRS